MLVLRRLMTLARAFGHELKQTFVSPELAATRALKELDGEVQGAEDALVKVGSELKLLEEQRTRAHSDAAQWGEVAAKAAAEADLVAARAALERQVVAEELVVAHQACIERMSANVTTLRVRYERLKVQRNGLRSRLNLLDARRRMADAEARVARSVGGIAGAAPIDLDGLEEGVLAQEAQATALSEFAGERVSALGEPVAAIASVDERLARLTQRTGEAGDMPKQVA